MTAPLNRKPIFDAVRAMIGGDGFTSAEVAALDRAIDAAEGKATGTPTRTSEAGIALLHHFEGFAKALPDGRVQAYPDPGTGGKPYTIGFGTTTDEQGKPIPEGTIWTRVRAEARFLQHLAQFEREVLSLLDGKPTTQNQFDALVSFAYNLGTRALDDSTLLRMHKAGDYEGAAGQFGRWVNAGGRRMAGLVRRREAEAKLYRGQS